MTPKTENVPRLLMICSKFIDDDFDFFLSEHEPMPLLSTNGNFRKISKLRTAVDPFFIIIALSGEHEGIGPGLNGVRLRGAGRRARLGGRRYPAMVCPGKFSGRAALTILTLNTIRDAIDASEFKFRWNELLVILPHLDIASPQLQIKGTSAFLEDIFEWCKFAVVAVGTPSPRISLESAFRFTVLFHQSSRPATYGNLQLRGGYSDYMDYKEAESKMWGEINDGKNSSRTKRTTAKKHTDE